MKLVVQIQMSHIQYNQLLHISLCHTCCKTCVSWDKSNTAPCDEWPHTDSPYGCGLEVGLCKVSYNFIHVHMGGIIMSLVQHSCLGSRSPNLQDGLSRSNLCRSHRSRHWPALCLFDEPAAADNSSRYCHHVQSVGKLLYWESGSHFANKISSYYGQLIYVQMKLWRCVCMSNFGLSHMDRNFTYTVWWHSNFVCTVVANFNK